MQENDNTIVTHQVDNAVFLPEVVALIAEGHTVTLPLRGRSMRPFLEDGRDKALLAAPTDIATGDVVLAEIAKGHFVLHRIISINPWMVTLLGDGNMTMESCRPHDIQAKAIGFYRKGRNKPDMTTDLKWRLYSAVWTKLRPIRRYLLFLAHPHIPQRFKTRFPKTEEN